MGGKTWPGPKPQSHLHALGVPNQTVALPSCALQPELFISQQPGVQPLEGAGMLKGMETPLFTTIPAFPQTQVHHQGSGRALVCQRCVEPGV